MPVAPLSHGAYCVASYVLLLKRGNQTRRGLDVENFPLLFDWPNQPPVFL